MFYYAEINSDYLVIEVHSLTEASTNANYIAITEDQYTNGDLVNKYYNALTGNFEVMVSSEFSGSSNWHTYGSTMMILTTKLDNMQSEINTVSETQKAIKTELNKKVEVAVDTTQNMLVFST